MRVKVWETPTSFAEYGRSDRTRGSSTAPPHRLRSRRHAGRFPPRPRRIGERAARGVRRAAAARGRRSGGWSATARRRSWRARLPRPAVRSRPTRSTRFLAIYNGRLLQFTRPYPGHPGGARDARVARHAGGADEQAARRRRARFSTGLEPARAISPPAACSAAMVRYPRKPDPAGLRSSVRRGRRRAERDGAGRRLDDRLADGARGGHTHLPGAVRLRVRGLSDRACSTRGRSSRVDQPAELLSVL